MILTGLTPRQRKIATLLWETSNKDEVLLLVKAAGPDGLIVMNLMVASMLDDYMETDLAEVELDRIKAL